MSCREIGTEKILGEWYQFLVAPPVMKCYEKLWRLWYYDKFSDQKNISTLQIYAGNGNKICFSLISDQFILLVSGLLSHCLKETKVNK